MGRISRGWTLTKESWAVVRGDPSLAFFPILAGITALIAAAIFFAIGFGAGAAADADWPVYVVLAIGLYAITTISIFFAVALAACAARSLEGEDTTLRQGLSAAWTLKGKILSWAAVQVVVGALISILQALLREAGGAVVSSIVGGLANFAWTAATFFVIPQIALEGKGPIQAIKGSVATLRQKWGEGATGAFAIGGIVFLLGWLPAIALIAGGVLLVDSVQPLAIALIALGTIVLVIAIVVQNTIMSVFRVALYRFATEDRTLGSFDRGSLEAAFRKK